MDEATLESQGWTRRSFGGFIDCAGPIWTRRRQPGFSYGMLIEPKHLNAQGIVHGGALETLIDHAVSLTAWEACARTPCVTLQLDTHFVAAVRLGAFVEAVGTVVRKTPGIVFMQGALTVDDQTVLTAQALMKIRSARQLTDRAA
ncbi:PaaI family thioesterase [soil metagenome]